MKTLLHLPFWPAIAVFLLVSVVLALWLLAALSLAPGHAWATASMPAPLGPVGAVTEPARSARPEDARLERVDVVQKLDTELPLHLRFTDEAGNDVELGSYFRNRPVVLALVYYECPMLCTLVLDGLVRSLKAVPFEAGRDFDVVAVSIDPGETAELAAKKKAAYVKRYDRGRPEGWHFLTGTKEAIDRLADTIGFSYSYDAERDQYAHAAMITAATPAGRLSRYFFGIEYPARDLRLALAEASEGRIGGLVERLLLLCYHYDPLTGRYSAVAMNAVRVGGALTALALAGSIFGVVRRDTRRRRNGHGGHEAPPRDELGPDGSGRSTHGRRV